MQCTVLRLVSKSRSVFFNFTDLTLRVENNWEMGKYEIRVEKEYPTMKNHEEP